MPQSITNITNISLKFNAPPPFNPNSKKLKIIAPAFLYKYSPQKIRFLLLQRPVDEDYLWTTPGGKVEGKETYSEACRREVKEETGLIIAPYPLNYTFFTKQSNAIIEGHPFYFKIDSQTITLSHEHIGFGFFTVQEAMHLQMLRETKHALLYANQIILRRHYASNL
ncbi:MAG: NUDIX hydrolase [Nanoarchaeota archaeon]